MKARSLIHAGLLSLALSAPAVGQTAGEPVKIGVLADMTGTYSDIGGMGTVEAARMAIEDFGGSVLGQADRARLCRRPEQGRHRRRASPANGTRTRAST